MKQIAGPIKGKRTRKCRNNFQVILGTKAHLQVSRPI